MKTKKPKHIRKNKKILFDHYGYKKNFKVFHLTKKEFVEDKEILERKL